MKTKLFPKKLVLFIVLSFLNTAIIAQSEPAFRDVSTQTFNASSGVYSFSINKPAGAVDGDLMILSVGVRNDNTIAIPTGWSTISTTDHLTNNLSFAVFYKYCTASDPSSYTVSWTSNEGPATSRDAVASIIAYEVDGLPFIRYASAEGSSLTPTAPDTTSLYDGNRVVRVAIIGDNAVTGHSMPGGSTSRVAIESSTSSEEMTMLVADEVQASAGATGTSAFGIPSSSIYRSFTIAFYDPSELTFTPFSCTTELYQTTGNNSTATTLQQLNTTADAYILIGGDIDHNYNGIGYNVNDNYMYGFGRGNKNLTPYGKIPRDLNQYLVQIASNGEVKQLASVGVNSFSADMDFDGNLWALESAGFKKVSITAPYTVTEYTPEASTSGDFEVVNDIVYITKNGKDFLYGVEGDGSDYYLYRFELDHVNEEVITTKTIIAGFVPADLAAGGNLAGAMFTDFNNNLFAAFNTDGSIWIISDYENTPTGIKLATAGATPQNDGASCPYAFSRFFKPLEAKDDTGADLNEGVAGTTVADVITNDEFDSNPASLTVAPTVDLSFVSSSNAGITLNTTTGAVSVSAAVTPGAHTLVYQICETAIPHNCSEATVTFNVIGIDTDGDGVIDYLDEDDDNDGVLDTDELSVNSDADGDGIPNNLDLDSDNDGIPDIIEAGGVDNNNDGIVDDTTDTDDDGWADTFDSDDGGSALADTNSDGDGLEDRIDIDSDNDGIVDVIEAQGTNSYVVPLHTDNDSDGIDDAFDSDYVVVGAEIVLGGFISTLSNIDADSNPDYRDTDSDGDGTTDQGESGVTAAGSTTDTDGDGLYNDYDSDGASATNNGKSDNGGQTPTSFTNSTSSAERDWRYTTSIIYWDGTSWYNGSNSGVPDGDESLNGKTVIIVLSGSDAPMMNNVSIPNLYIARQATLVVSGCFTVTGNAGNGGLMRLESIGDDIDEYGQYLGPSLRNVECQMYFDNGWHNIGFPVQITASEWAEENNTGNDTVHVNMSNVDTTQNFRWYDSYTSGGKEFGFFISDDLSSSTTYQTHTYGQWNLVSDGTEKYEGEEDQDLTAKAFSYFIDENFFNDSRILSATGTTNDGEITYSTSNNFGGFNMIPNIYPVSIDANKVWNTGTHAFKNLSNIDKVIYMWDPSNAYEIPLEGDYANGSYVAFDPETGNAITAVPEVVGKADHLIAPFQAFYIRRSDASTNRRRDEDGTDIYSTPGPNGDAVSEGATTDPAVTHVNVDVTISPDFRSSCQSTKHFKTTEGLITDVMMLHTLEAYHNTNTGDATEIAFADHYTQGYDLSYDIAKTSTGGIDAPTLFTILEDKALVINKQSYPEGNHRIPVGFTAPKGKDGTRYLFKASKLPKGWSVYLEDQMTGSWHDLTKRDYNFTYDKDYKLERFAIVFNKTGDKIESDYRELVAWGQEEGIEVRLTELESETAEVILMNLQGQVLHINKAARTQENYIIPISNVGASAYIVTIKTAGKTHVLKVFR